MKALSSGLIPDSIPIPEGKLLLAFSGGKDSLFLMYVLSLAAKERTEALYVNHGIRGKEELEREEAQNLHNASVLGIPLTIRRLDKGAVSELAGRERIGTEAAARKLRYSILKDYAAENGFEHILTAHHLDDQAETVAMRLLSSSPLYALSGIQRSEGIVFRPLLDISRENIERAVKALGLVCSEDSTNCSDAYFRNRVRHTIMPSVSEKEKRMMAQIASNVSEIRGKVSIPDGGGNFYAEYSRSELLALNPVARALAFFHIAQHLGISGRISSGLIDGIMERIEIGSGRFILPSISVFPIKDRVRFYPELPHFACEWNWQDTAIGKVVVTSKRKDDLTLMINPSALVGPAIVRRAEEGDRIELRLGSKSVSDLEREWHVPYSIVIEDREGIVAVLASLFGGRDRLAERFLGRGGKPVALAYAFDCIYINSTEKETHGKQR